MLLVKQDHANSSLILRRSCYMKFVFSSTSPGPLLHTPKSTNLRLDRDPRLRIRDLYPQRLRLGNYVDPFPR